MYINTHIHAYMYVYHHIFCFVLQYNFKSKYSGDKNHNTTVGFFNSSYIHYCPAEEVPINDIFFVVHYDENGAGDFPGTPLKLNN